jgi:hypothetical protein
MPCCGICGNQGHNRRTCQQQWQILEANRRVEEYLSSTSEAATDLDLNYLTPSTRNRRPVVSETQNNPNSSPIIFETSTVRTLFSELENIDFGTLFSDTDSLEDELNDMISYPKLVECVEEPCQTQYCPICMDDLKQTDLIITRCGHQFHGTCMLKHMKKHDNCPMCRGVLFTKAITI